MAHSMTAQRPAELSEVAAPTLLARADKQLVDSIATAPADLVAGIVSDHLHGKAAGMLSALTGHDIAALVSLELRDLLCLLSHEVQSFAQQVAVFELAAVETLTALDYALEEVDANLAPEPDDAPDSAQAA